MSLSETYLSRKKLLADNLESMGVSSVDETDGLTTLINAVLDIEPSIGGLDLDTAVTISSSESSISLGSSIVLTSKLTASYDDETIVDVDLSGVLQNATLLFKNGNTTIGTAVTDVNGVATFTYTPPSVGTLSLKTIFAGTDNFNNCESSFINVTVVAPSYDDIVLTADDSILSYYDGDSTTLRAQLMDGTSTASVSGVTVEFFNGSTSLGTAQTDNNGVATKTYTSTGAGDVSLKAEADNGTLVSKTYSLEDCRDYQPLTSNAHESRWTIPSGVTSSYSDNGWRISANGYKQVKLTDKLTTACSVEFTISDYSNVATQAVIVFAYTNGETTPNLAILQGGTSASNLRKVFTTQLDHDLIKGGKYRIEYTTSTIKVYENNALLGESTNTIGFPTRFEWHIGANGRYAIYKDLKVKPL